MLYTCPLMLEVTPHRTISYAQLKDIIYYKQIRQKKRTTVIEQITRSK